VYVSLTFKIEGLERTDITGGMESSMAEVLAKVLKIPKSAIRTFAKVDVAPRGARVRRNLVATKAVKITIPLYVTVFTTTQWEGSVVATDSDVLAYVISKFAAVTRAATDNFIIQSLDALRVSRERRTRDTALLNAIHSNPSLLPYMDPVDITVSNSAPTQAPTDFILPIGADKPSEDVVGMVLYSLLGVAGAILIMHVLKHLRRHFLLQKQQALLHARKKQVKSSARKVVKSAMTVLQKGVQGRAGANGSSEGTQSMSVGSAVDSSAGSHKNSALMSPMHAFAYKKIAPLPQDDPHDEKTWTSAVPEV